MPLCAGYIGAHVTDPAPIQIVVIVLGSACGWLLMKRNVYNKINHAWNLLLVISAYITGYSLICYSNTLNAMCLVGTAGGIVGFQCVIHECTRKTAQADVNLLNRITQSVFEQLASMGTIVEIMEAQKRYSPEAEDLKPINDYWEGLCRSCSIAVGSLRKLGKKIDKKHPLRGYYEAVARILAGMVMTTNSYRSITRQQLEEATGTSHVASDDANATYETAARHFQNTITSAGVLGEYVEKYLE